MLRVLIATIALPAAALTAETVLPASVRSRNARAKPQPHSTPWH